MASALEQPPPSGKVKAKVWAGSAGAGIGGGIGYAAALLVAESMTWAGIHPSPEWIMALGIIVTAVVSWAGSFGAGYAKTETVL